MKLYLESSVLVKLFKREPHSDKMIELISRMDEGENWSGYTSNWTLLEVARALKKEGKPTELIKLNIGELKSHRINFREISPEILVDAENLVAEYNVYAADALHSATFRRLKKTNNLEGFLTDDKHFSRLKEFVTPLQIRDITL